ITHLAFKDLTDKCVKILNAKNLLLKQDNLQMKADIENLKKQVDFLNKNMAQHSHLPTPIFPFPTLIRRVLI
ncbi:hypothetical protein SERLA73DRAFT_144436, partial [Serpula lacrymans var. lacrymans S7.3]